MTKPTEVQEKRSSGRYLVVGFLIIVCAAAGLWVSIERQMPVLDTKPAKKLIANFEKLCRTTRTAQKCREIVGEYHTRCLLLAASKVEGEVFYDKKVYVHCLNDSDKGIGP